MYFNAAAFARGVSEAQQSEGTQTWKPRRKATAAVNCTHMSAALGLSGYGMKAVPGGAE